MDESTDDGARQPDEAFTVESARAAAERDDLGSWVVDFLASPGSDNAALAEDLSDPPRWWLGPVQLASDQLHRLAGPAGDPVLEAVDEDDWRDDVDDLARRIEDGLEPPPVVVSYRNGQLVLEDGNHRLEALRRVGRRGVWSVVGFEDPDERDRFIARAEVVGAAEAAAEPT